MSMQLGGLYIEHKDNHLAWVIIFIFNVSLYVKPTLLIQKILCPNMKNEKVKSSKSLKWCQLQYDSSSHPSIHGFVKARKITILLFYEH